MYTLRSFILFGMLCCFNEFQAQFSPQRLFEKDLPKKIKFNTDPQNTKYKDEPFVYKDSSMNMVHAVWTQFDDYKSKNKKDLSVIYYANSSDSGRTWTQSKQVNRLAGDCLNGDSTLKGPMIGIGMKGELYITWAGPSGLAFQRSLDHGKTWLDEEKRIAPIKNGWSYKVNGVQTNGLPQLACDLSKSEFSGRIYVCWGDEKAGEKNKDVFLVYSDDKGESWTEPILVTFHPNHKEQFCPRLQVDPKTGKLYILYFDKQNSYSGEYSDLYLAQSENGGLKFDYYQLNQFTFKFNSNYHALEYTNQIIKAYWMQATKADRFGYFSVSINDSSILAYQAKWNAKEMKIERNFMFSQNIKIDYEISNNSIVTAVLTKPLDSKFEKILFENKRCFAGKNKFDIDTKIVKLPRDTYILSFYYLGRNSFVWIIAE